MRTGLWAAAGIVLGSALGWMALRSGMWGRSLEAVAAMDWRVLLLAMCAVLFAALLESYRWKLLLPKERVSTARLFWVRNVGLGLNNVSPVRMMGEVVQTAMLRQGDGIGPAKVVSSLVMARLFDLLVTVNLVGAGLIVLPQLAGLRMVVAPLWGMTVAATVGLLLWGKRLHRIPLVRRFGPLEAILVPMGALGARRGLMLGCVLITATAWLAIGTASWLVAQTAGIDLPFWLMSIVIVAVTLFSSATPAPPAAVGVYEFGAISTLGLFAVDPTVALTFALVIHAMLFAPAILLAMVGLALDRQTLRRVLELRSIAARRRAATPA